MDPESMKRYRQQDETWVDTRGNTLLELRLRMATEDPLDGQLPDKFARFLVTTYDVLFADHQNHPDFKPIKERLYQAFKAGYKLGMSSDETDD